MSTTLIIDPEFRALIPPLTAEERQQLEANLKADGCRDPFVVWNGVLLDGHHRYEICTAHQIPFRTVEQSCADRIAAKVWIVQHQLGRRNLTDLQRAELVLYLEPLLATAAKERSQENLKQFADAPTLSNDNIGGRTAKKLAQIAGISESAMNRAILVKKRGSPELQAQVRSGQVALSRAALEVAAGRFGPITDLSPLNRPREPRTPHPLRKESDNTTALAHRLAAIHGELHRKRVANHDDMKTRRWIPDKISVVAQKEILDWIETTLETLVSELHAHMLKDASGTRALKSRATSNGEPEHGHQKTHRHTH